MPGTRHPDPPSPVPGSVVCSMTATSRGLLQQMVPITIPRSVDLLKAVLVPGTHHPAVPGPVPVIRLVTSIASRYLQTPNLITVPAMASFGFSRKYPGCFVFLLSVWATTASYENSSVVRYSARDYSSKWSPQEVGAAASSRPSSLGAAPVSSVSALPSRPVAATPLAGTSHPGCSLPMAPSQRRSWSQRMDEDYGGAVLAGLCLCCG